MAEIDRDKIYNHLIEFDEIYNRLIGFIDAITTNNKVSNKDIENLIQNLEQNIGFDTFILTGKEPDDLLF